MYRDLAVLQEAGVPIADDTENGEVRYRLAGNAIPPLAPTALQLAALALARRALATIDDAIRRALLARSGRVW